MRALLMQLMADGRREKLLSELPDLAPIQGKEVRTQTLVTGVTNGTEKNNLLCGNYAMPDDALPVGYGYQNVGRVTEVGPDVENLKVGDVLFMSDDHHEFLNYSEDNLLIKLSDGIDITHAALFGVAGVAMHDVRRAETKLGDRVLVVGAGPIGQFTAQAARASGAHVTVVDLDQHRLDLALECGADAVFQITGDETWAAIREAGQFDIVFEDSGADVLGKIIGVGWGDGVIKTRGKVVVIAGRDDVVYKFNSGQGCEVAILQASHFDNSDLAEVMRLVEAGVIRVGPLIQEVAKPADAQRIYDALRDNSNSLMGTVFDWR